MEIEPIAILFSAKIWKIAITQPATSDKFHIFMYIEVINEYEEPHKLVTLNVSLEEALKRNKTRSKHRTEKNIIEAYAQLLKTKIKDYSYK